MSELRRLFPLPLQPRVEIVTPQIKRPSLPIDIARVSIVGFTDESLTVFGEEAPVWPIPLIQIDGEPEVSDGASTQFYTPKYDGTSKTLGSKLVNTESDAHARIDTQTSRGKAGQRVNEAFYEAMEMPDAYNKLVREEKRKLYREAYIRAKKAHGGPMIASLDAYLFPDGPIAYDQEKFGRAVRTTAAFHSLAIILQ